MQANRWTTRLATAGMLGLGSLLVPADGHAAIIGHFKEGTCAAFAGDYAARILAAGHTPVALNSLDAASLAALDGLVLASGCIDQDFFATNSAVNDAVAGGMALFLQVQRLGLGQGTPLQLPGIPSFSPAVIAPTIEFGCSLDVSLASGSPIANGPGGSLTQTGLDNPDVCGLTYWFDGNALPFGGTPLLVDARDPAKVGAFAYSHGNGRVVFSIDQIQLTMTGGYLASRYPRPGSDAYITNTIAWLMPKAPATTCASEGYSGTKLAWCKNICENGLTGAALDTWIHRWVNRYRDLPYCAAGDEEEPPQET